MARRPSPAAVLAALLVLAPSLAVEAVRLRLDPSSYEACQGGAVPLNLTLENPTADQQLYTLSMEDPDGAFARPERSRRSVGRGGSLSTSWALSAAQGAREGEHRFAVRAALDVDGSLYASAAGTLRVRRCAQPGPGASEPAPSPSGGPPPWALAIGAALAVVVLASALALSRWGRAAPAPAAVPEAAQAYPQQAYVPNPQATAMSYYYYRYSPQQ